MDAKKLVSALPPSHQLAFMTACLSRAVELCRGRIPAEISECLTLAVEFGWRAVAGAAPSAEERIAVHKRAEWVAVRNSPQRAGSLELYLTANAATFVLGVLANSDNLAYAPNAKHWVPDVIGVLHPAEHPAMAQAERVWHLKVLERLSNLTEAPTSEWFAANWEA